MMLLIFFAIKIDSSFFFSEGLAKAVVNRNYLPELISLINSAQKTLDIFMYSARIYPDYEEDIGEYILKPLRKAIKKGVKVRIILEASDWNKDNALKNSLFGNEIRKAGGEVVYDPTSITSHDKLIVIDSIYTLVGSMNWSFFALQSNNEASVLVKSKDIGLYFLKYMAEVKKHSMKNLPAYYGTIEKPSVEEKKKGSKGSSMPFSPQDKFYSALIYPIPNREYISFLHELLTQAEKSIKILMLSARIYLNQYKYNANDIIIRDLIAAKERGIDVEIILDGSSFNRFNTMDNKRFLDTLKVHGIKTYFDTPDITTHAKMVIVDGKWSIVSSTNWSYHALELNDEAGVALLSNKLAHYYTKYFIKIKQKGSQKPPEWYREW